MNLNLGLRFKKDYPVGGFFLKYLGLCVQFFRIIIWKRALTVLLNLSFVG